MDSVDLSRNHLSARALMTLTIVGSVLVVLCSVLTIVVCALDLDHARSTNKEDESPEYIDPLDL